MEMHQDREVADSLVVAPVLRRFEQRLTKENGAPMSQIAIGLDPNTSLAYEGSLSLYGRVVYPSPFMSIACHIGTLPGRQQWSMTDSLLGAAMLFREDSFDPVARVRRGRLYLRAERSPAPWRVVHDIADVHGSMAKDLATFLSWRASDEFFRHRSDAVLVLGSGDRATVHTVLDVERLANGEELITVRTRANLSGLPNLVESLLPEKHADLIKEQYEKAANSAFRDDAESVIDRCREAAAAALNAEYLLTETSEVSNGKELAKLAEYFEGQKRFILSNSARTIALLHSRAKSVERLKRGISAPNEADAELAIALLGSIYRELRWVR
ncbi:TPA: hypothetical protein U2L33_004501 [Burkholderia cenocepacia]|nr:hypothetical protein [Burkholderia cenocepacia]